MPAKICPERERLLAFQTGELAEGAADTVIEHLSACTSCQAVVGKLNSDEDPVAARLRVPPVEDPVLSEAACQSALARAKSLPKSQSSSPRPSEARGPAQNPGGKAGAPPRQRSAKARAKRKLGGYELQAKLGEGGMGTVFKAVQAKLDRVVAVKILAKRHLGNEEIVARFDREMKAIGRLNHPNIVQAFDAQESGGVRFLIMEYVDGEDFSMLVDRHGPLPIAEACELIRQAAEGLQYAHQHGMVHRDVKPSNLMLSGEGVVKILDLGLARLQDLPQGKEITSPGQVMGTPDFMSPEQFSDSRQVDIRSDVYSLGCALYKLLTGQAPFDGPEYSGNIQKFYAHLHEPVPPIRELRPEVPDELAQVLDRMLAKDPQERYATPAQVAQVIGQFASSANLTQLLKERLEPRVAPPVGAPAAGSTQNDLFLPIVDTNVGRSAPVSSKWTIWTTQLAARRWKPWKIAAAVGTSAAGLVLALGIVLSINRGGRETTVEVPDGSEIRVDADGAVDVTLPGQRRAAVHRSTTGDGTTTRPPGTAVPAQLAQMPRTLTGHTKYVICVGFSRDGSMLASGSWDQTARVWDVATGRLLQTIEGNTQHMDSVVFSDDGATLFSGVISLWDVASGRYRRKLEGHRHWVTGIALSPDGNTLASCGRGGSVCLWEAKTGLILREVDLKNAEQGGPFCVAWSPDGLMLATGDADNLVKVWDANTAGLLHTCAGHTDHVWDVAFFADGASLVSTGKDGTLRIWDVATGKEQRTIDAQSQRVWAVAVSPDGRTLASGHSDSTVRLWDLPSLKLSRLLEGHTGEVHCVAFSPDGSLLASGGVDNTVKLWSLHRGKLSPSPDADRRAAEWVLGIGGRVKVRMEGTSEYVELAGDLPAESFRVVGVYLSKNQRFAGEDLRNIEGLTELQALDLHVTQATDRGLECLNRFTELRTLWLSDTQVTDALMQHVKGMTTLQSLHLSDTDVGDAGLEQIQGLTELQSLRLKRTRVSDIGMKHLEGLKGLRYLDLSATQVSDTGLQCLQGLTELQKLYLSDTQVTDVGLEQLERLTALTSLNLGHTGVTDASLPHLKRFPELEFLGLSGDQVTDTGLENIKGLQKLFRVYLDGTQITDRGLDHLKELTNLRSLHLGHTQVSDAGIERLEGLTNLEFLGLGDTRVTEAGVAALARALVDCRIRVDTAEPEETLEHEDIAPVMVHPDR